MRIMHKRITLLYIDLFYLTFQGLQTPLLLAFSLLSFPEIGGLMHVNIPKEIKIY